MINPMFLCSVPGFPGWQLRTNINGTGVELSKFMTDSKLGTDMEAFVLHQQLMGISAYRRILLAVANAGGKLQQLEEESVSKVAS